MSNNKIYIRMNDNIEETDGQCPSWALAVGYLGVTSSVVLCNFGSAVSVVVVCVLKKLQNVDIGEMVGLLVLEWRCTVKLDFYFYSISSSCIVMVCFSSLCLDSL